MVTESDYGVGVRVVYPGLMSGWPWPSLTDSLHFIGSLCLEQGVAFPPVSVMVTCSQGGKGSL